MSSQTAAELRKQAEQVEREENIAAASAIVDYYNADYAGKAFYSVYKNAKRHSFEVVLYKNFRLEVFSGGSRPEIRYNAEAVSFSRTSRCITGAGINFERRTNQAICDGFSPGMEVAIGLYDSLKALVKARASMTIDQAITELAKHGEGQQTSPNDDGPQYFGAPDIPHLVVDKFVSIVPHNIYHIATGDNHCYYLLTQQSRELLAEAIRREEERNDRLVSSGLLQKCDMAYVNRIYSDIRELREMLALSSL